MNYNNYNFKKRKSFNIIINYESLSINKILKLRIIKKRKMLIINTLNTNYIILYLFYSSNFDIYIVKYFLYISRSTSIIIRIHNFIEIL